jgi:adenylyl-sulfate kinase
MKKDITWHPQGVGKNEKSSIKNQKPCILWFTGLSGSGKSTVANAVECKLYAKNRHTSLLDGDNVRHNLCKDLGFSHSDRAENIRRIGEVAKLMTDNGLIVLTAFISPFMRDRDMVRAIFNNNEFIEIFIDTPLEECENRDTKGLYKKARNGELKNYTGIDSPYEKPINPEIIIANSKVTVDEASDQVINYLLDNKFLTL